MIKAARPADGGKPLGRPRLRARLAERITPSAGMTSVFLFAQGHEPARALGRLDVDRQLVRLAGQVLELLDGLDRLDLPVGDDLGDHLALLEARGLGGAPLLDRADE